MGGDTAPAPIPTASLDQLGVTRRESEVLSALADRLTNAEIAARLHVSERTVESHVASLMRKFAAPNRFVLGEAAKTIFGWKPDHTQALPAALELLADATTFVGRAAQLDWLRSQWHKAVSGQVVVAIVAGEAGIGKSRLVAEFATEVHAAGTRVLLGSCLEDASRPFEPFVQALHDDMAGLGEPELRRRAGGTAAALARIIPEVTSRIGLPEASEVFDAAWERADAFAGMQGYLSRAAEAQPLVLVIEDVHWATTTTRDAIRHMARTGGAAQLMMVLTTRNVLPELDGALSAFLTDLEGLPTVDRVDLAGLPEDEVAVLLGALGESADPAAVASEANGNPLFVREVAARRGGRIGGSLAGLLARRYALLEDDDDAVVDMAAVLGTEFDVVVLSAALDRAKSDVVESLKRAEVAGLVTPTRGAPGAFAFVHALFRASRYESIPSSRRLDLHSRAASALAPRSDDDRVVAELARHACIAAPLAGARPAVEYAVRAAVAAEQALALDEAAAHYRRALDAADLIVPPDSKTRLDLMIRLGEVLQGAGDPEYSTVLTNAAAIARATGYTEALAEIGWVTVKYTGPRNPASPDPELALVAEEALRLLGPEPTAVRARTLAALAEALCFTEPERAEALAEEALAIAKRLDDPVALGHVLLSYRFAANTPDNVGSRQQRADELVAIGRQTGQSTFTILGLSSKAWGYRAEGNLAAADLAVDTINATVDEHSLPPTFMVAMTLYRSAGDILRGDLVAAEATADEVWATSSDGFNPANWYGPAIVTIRHLQGRLPELIPLVKTATLQPGIGDVFAAVLAGAYAHDGRLDEAGAIVRRYADEGFRRVPRNFMWLIAMVSFCEAVEILDDEAAARELARQLLPFSGHLADIPQTVLAPVDLALAQMALAAGDDVGAEHHAAAAVGASRTRGTPIFLGRELIRLAEARRRLGARTEETKPLVDEALAVADRTGARLIRIEAERYGLVDSP